MLRQHDSRFIDQASHDKEDRICPVCKEPDSIESVQHVLLHCPAYEHRRAALRTAVICLAAVHASHPVLLDDEGTVALTRDDFIHGRGRGAAVAVDTFLHAIITFRNHCVEQFWGGD